ncbi:MAG: enolase C-terminal domain-like protein [Thermomicrobiales bacterium]
MTDARIVRVEVGTLEGQRPRHAGKNARLDDHGRTVRVPLARLTTSDGATGFGVSRATQAQAQALLGKSLSNLFDPTAGVADDWLVWDYPLWDLCAKQSGQPVYALAAAINGQTPPAPYRARCYDTTLYFDDLHLVNHDDAARFIADEAREGLERGHRAFKVKIGRGARHLPLDAGTQRDILVIRAVRDVIGPEPPLLLDANNGYNLNLTKHVLEATADCGIFWIEEAFHEDPVLYTDLRAWLFEQGLPVLIADGEGDASPRLLEWAEEKVIDVVQYDIFRHGFTRWLATGQQLDAWGAQSAPHHYGGHYGNYAACHLAGAIEGFTFVEWDEATTPGLAAPGYVLQEGWVSVPNTPGFGLELDDAAFQAAVTANGFSVSRES